MIVKSPTPPPGKTTVATEYAKPTTAPKSSNLRAVTAAHYAQPKAAPQAQAEPRKRGRIGTAIANMQVSAWKIMGYTVLASLAGGLYLHHQFTTQAILRDVNRLQREFDQVRLRHDELRFTYQRMTGPAEVYSRAGSLGLVEGGPADERIRMED